MSEKLNSLMSSELPPTLKDIGIVPASPFQQGDIEDVSVLNEIVAVRESHLDAWQKDTEWATTHSHEPDLIFEPEDQDYQRYREYLADAKLSDDNIERREPDEISLDEYEKIRLREYHPDYDGYPLTNGFVAQFARDSARSHRYKAAEAGVLVGFKYLTGLNIELLEVELSDEDRSLYGPLRDRTRDLMEEEALAFDPEAKRLFNEYKILEATFNKRWAILALASILGTEIDYRFNRERVEELAAVFKHYGGGIKA